MQPHGECLPGYQKMKSSAGLMQSIYNFPSFTTLFGAPIGTAPDPIARAIASAHDRIHYRTHQISRLSKCPSFTLAGAESLSGSQTSPVGLFWIFTPGVPHPALIYLKKQSVSFPLWNSGLSGLWSAPDRNRSGNPGSRIFRRASASGFIRGLGTPAVLRKTAGQSISR